MKFSDTPGHLSIKDSLRHLADSKRIPHAIMLSGPSGIGKMNIARTFAQYIHCENPNGGEPCGRCPSCLQHRNFNHPDLHFSFPIKNPGKPNRPVSDFFLDQWKEMLSDDPLMSLEKWMEIIDTANSQPQIFVDESAEIIRKAAMSPFAAEYKIFIIWLPEKLKLEAANKLLKIIEEPFDDTIFILVSNEPDKILPTIFSRTQRFNLSPLSGKEITDFIKKRFSLDPETLANVVRLAEGRPAKALSLAGSGDETVEFSAFFKAVMRNSYAKKVAVLRELSEKGAAMGREKLSRLLDYCSRMVRENFIYNLGIGQLNAMTKEEENFSVRFAPFIHAGNVEEMAAQIQRAKADIQRNANSKVVMFDLLLYIITLIHKK